MNRVLDDARLVGNLVDLEADGQILLDGRDFFLEVLAELEHVAAVLHRDGDADGALAIEIHARLCGLDRTALDFRDVAEAENLAICVDGQRLDVLDIVKRARDAQVDVVGGRFELARGRHLVLCLERLQDGIRAHAELHELCGLGLDVDLFLLHALELDFLDVRHLHEQAARILGRAAHFFITVAVARHGVDRAIDVVEAVVVIWPIDAVRQLALLVLAEIAHVAPCLADLRLVHVIGEVDIDDRLPRARLAVDVVEARRVLKLLFELVCDLILHLVSRRAGPGRRNDHLANRELRVFHAAELVVAENAANRRDDDEVPDERLVLEGDFGEIPHFNRTSCPSRRVWTPAVTIVVPAATPCTRTWLSSNCSTVTGWRATVPSSLTTQTSGLSPVW